jgi:hypothetical protein
MSDFTTSVQNIAKVYASTPVQTRQQTQQVATLIQNGTYDSVNFSNESQNLFQIAQIDSTFDELFSVPNALSADQQPQLEKLGTMAQNLFLGGSLELASTDYDGILANIQKIYEGKEMTKKEQDELVNLTAQLQSYIQNLSITQLFSSENSGFFTTSNTTTNTFFNEKLTESEKADLGKISQQLNRLLFTANDESGSSFLDSLNSIYGLNSPSQEENDDIFSLFSQRNSLLSSVLLNRNLTSNYGDLL